MAPHDQTGDNPRALLHALIRERIDEHDPSVRRALERRIRILEDELGEPHVAWPDRPNGLQVDEYVDVA